ncbi:MAG: NAD-binding protein [Cytophagales bacterium]|nr:NAD-binding protein [Cytophagales bacterium]
MSDGASGTSINQAVVVGGGLIGIEMAEMLLSRKISVTMPVVNKNSGENCKLATSKLGVLLIVDNFIRRLT